MGRQMLGDSKRTEVVSTRMTKAQKQELERVYGKAGDALHAFMVAYFAQRGEKK
jgi:hypothetical protein